MGCGFSAKQQTESNFTQEEKGNSQDGKGHRTSKTHIFVDGLLSYSATDMDLTIDRI